MKKNLQTTALAIALAIGSVSAQTGKVASKNQPVLTNNVSSSPAVNQALTRGCGTQIPSAEWDAWFNKEVEKFIAANPGGKSQMAAYTIPIVFHIIHTGQASGTYPNLNIAQINSQLTVLNQDYASNGLNVGNLPAVFASAKANTNVTFCMAQKNPTGSTLVEPGVDRIACSSKGWANPTSFTSMSTFQNFIDGTVKPNSIWDPTRYFNVWVTDCASAVGLLGYATFPIGTGLVGITGNGTATTDGVWCYSAAIGSNSIFAGGTYAAPYNKGRTLVHEAGHWMGLRHIWGDGTCLTDYCNDTPPAQTSNFSCSSGCTGGCFTAPYKSGVCAGNTTGEMTQNFMDYTDDACMYIFTNDQTTRIQTAMANGTYRSQLTASSATLCSLSAATPTANILVPATACSGAAVTTTNNSLGTPAPTYVWSTTPAAGVTYNPNNTASNPQITFATAGAYTVSCVATNSLGSNSNSKNISITACATICNDTIMNITNTQTLTLATAGSDTTTPGCSPKAGYIFGSNCYQDQEKAEFFPLSLYSSISTPKIVSVIAIFYKDGTKGTGGTGSVNVPMKIYNGTMAGGPTGTTTPLATVNANMSTILAAASTNSVNYCGQAGIVYTNPILKPYRYLLATPVAAPATNGFFASIKIPTTAGDTAVVMHAAAGTGTNWEYWSPSNWYNVSTAWTGFNASMAILPEITCNPTAINMNSMLDKNIAIMPNPSTGIVNVMTFLPNAQDINITVTNMLGQMISSTDFTNVTSNSFTVDLTSKDNGVYFISIRNGEERIVKRVVIAK